MTVILASSSPRRRALLRAMGIPHRVRHAGVDEHCAIPGGARQLVRANARLKAEAVAKRLRQGVVLGADTIVVLRGRILGKPADFAEAVAMLTRLGGRTHTVYTGVCVVDVAKRREWVSIAATRVTLRTLSRRAIEAYVRRTKPYDKAGAYAVQDPRVVLVDRIQGSLSNVIGLPAHLVEQGLRWAGMRHAGG